MTGKLTQTDWRLYDGSDQTNDEGHVICSKSEIRPCNQCINVRGGTGKRIRADCRVMCCFFFGFLRIVCVGDEMVKPGDSD